MIRLEFDTTFYPSSRMALGLRKINEKSHVHWNELVID
jgi:hypothetical protein